MTNDPLAGRDIRVPERCRMLVATEDGVFLWPGSALVSRRGNGFFVMDPREVNSLVCSFFGLAAIDTPIQTVLEIACDQLRVGRTVAVQHMLDRLPLPVSPNGARLLYAIAKQQGLAVPDVTVANEQSGTVWDVRDAERFAKLHDDLKPQAFALEKAFNPGSAWDPAKHPRWPLGQSDGGQFRPGEGAGDGGGLRRSVRSLRRRRSHNRRLGSNIPMRRCDKNWRNSNRALTNRNTAMARKARSALRLAATRYSSRH